MASKEKEYLELVDKLKDFTTAFDALFVPSCIELVRDLNSVLLGETDEKGNAFDTNKYDYPDLTLVKLSDTTTKVKEMLNQVNFWNLQVQLAVKAETRHRTEKEIKVTKEHNIKKQEDPLKIASRMSREDILKLGKELGYIK